jgi:hypothetical protein
MTRFFRLVLLATPSSRFSFFFFLLAMTLPGFPGSSTVQANTSFSQSVQPIFERKCVACHACYESPCQLNLGSGEGMDRGASKVQVYDDRNKAAAPTRLFTDAQKTAEWRQKGFFPVLDDSHADAQAALLSRMISLGRQANFVPGEKLPDNIVLGVNRDNSCPADSKEMEKYAKKHPQEGMPLAVTGLSDAEYNTINTWLAEGGKIDSVPRRASSAENAEIRQWEAYLNRPGLREQVVARWLYEHLFLAHLYFSDIKGSQFFELVRSRTPSGEAVDVIATPTPNSNPGGSFYYRLRPLQGTIVFKTHITFALNPARLARTQEQFGGKGWTVTTLPGYSDEEQANPFTTFAAIPAKARYQFMLDNAEYFVRTFIRGPVCKGQIATDVIRDQFWTLFQEPERDLFVTDAAYREKATPLLGLPGLKDGWLDLGPQWLKYRDRRNDYEKLRAQSYAAAEPQGASFSDIWNGEGYNDNALLTIFRHYDSAAVRKGLIGEIPQTLWVMDYPLFERTYYVLVVNFDVFGSLSHKAQTRLYFDLIRNGAEMNFLRLLPPEERKREIADWYQGSGKLKMLIDYESPDLRSPTAESYDTLNPKAELAKRLLQRFHRINASPDPINRCGGGNFCYRAAQPEYIRKSDQALSRLASTPARELPVIDSLPEISLLRIYRADGQREIYSMLRNRAHSNVAFMMGEDMRYQAQKDTLTIYPGVLGGYPNFAFNIPEAEVEDFVAAMRAVKSGKDFAAIVQRWGVRRTSPVFWEIFHDFTTYLKEKETTEAGILDMNRWENL